MAAKKALPWILWGTGFVVYMWYAIWLARHGQGYSDRSLRPGSAPRGADSDARQHALVANGGYAPPQTASAGTAANPGVARRVDAEPDREVLDEIGELREEVCDLRDAFDAFSAPRDRHGLRVVNGGHSG